MLLPSSTHPLQVVQHLCNQLYRWLPLRRGARVSRRRSRARLSSQVTHSASRADTVQLGVPSKEGCPRQPVFPPWPAACVPGFLGTQSPPLAGCSDTHLLFLFSPCRFTASSVPQPRASGQLALTCPQTCPLSSSDSPASMASKPNTGCNYLKTALGFHHLFIHLGYKNNTSFYL